MKNEEFKNPLPPISESEQFEAHAPEEVYENLLELIEKTKQAENSKPSVLPKLVDEMEKFLTEKPAPPASWMKRFGANFHKYDYHQIVLPDDLCSPYNTEMESLLDIKSEYIGRSFQALEHFMIVRNHFLFDNGHAAPVECPKAILMLESEQRDQEVDWDCTFTLFADGSYQSYNLEKENEESIGAYGEEIIKLYPSVIQKLVLRLPQEGIDYGLFTQLEE